MQPAQEELRRAILQTPITTPICPIYQNVHGKPETDPEQIRKNLIDQLTAPVRWTQSVNAMIAAGITTFIEVGGSGAVLSGMIRKINHTVETETL
jgi:[acyl-carrier-protein] S-malonyltransferase